VWSELSKLKFILYPELETITFSETTIIMTMSLRQCVPASPAAGRVPFFRPWASRFMIKSGILWLSAGLLTELVISVLETPNVRLVMAIGVAKKAERKDKKKESQRKNEERTIVQRKNEECIICFQGFPEVPGSKNDRLNNVTLTRSCNHVFHKKCLERWLHTPDQERTNRCLMCQKEIDQEELKCIKKNLPDGNVSPPESNTVAASLPESYASPPGSNAIVTWSNGGGNFATSSNATSSNATSSSTETSQNSHGSQTSHDSQHGYSPNSHGSNITPESTTPESTTPESAETHSGWTIVLAYRAGHVYIYYQAVATLTDRATGSRHLEDGSLTLMRAYNTSRRHTVVQQQQQQGIPISPINDPRLYGSSDGMVSVYRGSFSQWQALFEHGRIWVQPSSQYELSTNRLSDAIWADGTALNNERLMSVFVTRIHENPHENSRISILNAQLEQQVYHSQQRQQQANQADSDSAGASDSAGSSSSNVGASNNVSSDLHPLNGVVPGSLLRRRIMCGVRNILSDRMSRSTSQRLNLGRSSGGQDFGREASEGRTDSGRNSDSGRNANDTTLQTVHLISTPSGRLAFRLREVTTTQLQQEENGTTTQRNETTTQGRGDGINQGIVTNQGGTSQGGTSQGTTQADVTGLERYLSRYRGGERSEDTNLGERSEDTRLESERPVETNLAGETGGRSESGRQTESQRGTGRNENSSAMMTQSQTESNSSTSDQDGNALRVQLEDVYENAREFETRHDDMAAVTNVDNHDNVNNTGNNAENHVNDTGNNAGSNNVNSGSGNNDSRRGIRNRLSGLASQFYEDRMRPHAGRMRPPAANSIRSLSRELYQGVMPRH